MQTLGTVKWFNNAKGYGFIQPDNGSDDVFAHFSAIEMDGFRTLKPGMRVQFTLAEGDKGAQAKDIQVIPGDGTLAKPKAADATETDYSQENPA
ncbi:MAG: cold-shock protein [Saezia sp.]